MANQEPPKDKQEDKDSQLSPYVSPRLRSKMAAREDDEEEKSPGTTIAVVALIAVIVLGGGSLLLSMNNAKQNAAKEKIAAAAAAKQAAADSAAHADSMMVVARADSLARAQAAALEAKNPHKKPPAPAATTPAATNTGAPGTAPAPAATPAPPRKYGIAVASFLFDDKAAAEKDRLAAATSLEGTVVPKTEGGATTYQVVLGSFDSKKAAEAKGAELLSAGTVQESRVIPLKSQ